MKSLIKRFSGEWLSVSRNYKKVYAHSPDAKTLVKKIEDKNIKDAMIIRIPSSIPSTYVG